MQQDSVENRRRNDCHDFGVDDDFDSVRCHCRVLCHALVNTFAHRLKLFLFTVSKVCNIQFIDVIILINRFHIANAMQVNHRAVIEEQQRRRQSNHVLADDKVQTQQQ